MKTYHAFADYGIKPKYNNKVPSRTMVDLSINLCKGTKLSLPIFSSNMKNVTGSKMAIEMWKHGCLGFLHRFSYQNSVGEALLQENLAEYREVVAAGAKCGVSLGASDIDKKRFDLFAAEGAKFFVIDIAHGHAAPVADLLRYIDMQIGSDRFEYAIMAGSVATPEGVEDLHAWGADWVRVGIGSGCGCSTRLNTGVGVPQMDCILEIRDRLPKCKIFSDGGVRHVRDICLAMIPADAVMIGSYFAGTSETPGNVYKNPQGQYYKAYGGSASAENKGSVKFVEGIMHTVPFKGKVKYLLREITEGLQSSCSYVNALNIQEFKQNAELFLMSEAAREESKV